LTVSLIIAACAVIPSHASATTRWKTKRVGSCTIAAGINPDATNNRYYIAGYIVCPGSGTRSMNCNTVHRHTLSGTPTRP
jgi:hypothetical protein